MQFQLKEPPDIDRLFQKFFNPCSVTTSGAHAFPKDKRIRKHFC